jgi:hypothetical protein
MYIGQNISMKAISSSPKSGQRLRSAVLKRYFAVGGAESSHPQKDYSFAANNAESV